MGQGVLKPLRVRLLDTPYKNKNLLFLSLENKKNVWRKLLFEQGALKPLRIRFLVTQFKNKNLLFLLFKNKKNLFIFSLKLAIWGKGAKCLGRGNVSWIPRIKTKKTFSFFSCKLAIRAEGAKTPGRRCLLVTLGKNKKKRSLFLV